MQRQWGRAAEAGSFSPVRGEVHHSTRLQAFREKSAMIRSLFFAAALAASPWVLSNSAEARHPRHHHHSSCGPGYSSYYSPGYPTAYRSGYSSYNRPRYGNFYRPGYSSAYRGYSPYSGYGRTGISIGIGAGGFGSPYGLGYPGGLGYGGLGYGGLGYPGYGAGGLGYGGLGYGGFGPGIRIGF